VLLAAACGGGDDGPPAALHPPPALGATRVFPNLSFSQPIALLQAPNDASRWFVVEQGGMVRVFANQPQATTSAVFADLRDRVDAGGEMGLLGMAFHPNFPTDPRVFFNYTNQDSGLVTRISEFGLDANGNVDTTPGRERILMTISQPQANHNGGHLAFGGDGFLYIGMGDGGGANDEPQDRPIGNGQLMTTVLGKMLRIDVDSASTPYGIPTDNPFAANPQLCNANGTGPANCPEIYASGFRNPWRWSFDRDNGDLWVGDVGQGQLEEIDRVERRGNYGWRCFEGTQATNLPCGSESPLLPPVAQYGRSEGAAVTGGYVYRGSAIAGLRGRYVFGDFISGQLWHIAADTQPTVRMTRGFSTELNISSFAEDGAGELYVVDYGGGLYRLTGN
jgi:glucose/arabinose dehydrogenase